ncbi:MAG TPA: transposase [Vicinamibacterales bacterium]|nr:transposase [Vicinamibacterales bacterium]
MTVWWGRSPRRPGLAPGCYFRLLLLGYVEGVDAERAIGWRAADSFALREFLALLLPERRPIIRRFPARVA